MRFLARTVLAPMMIVLAAAPAYAASNTTLSSAQAPRSGSIGVRLLDIPVTDDPRAGLYIVDHLAPGSTIHRRMEVSNSSDAVARVVLYPAAAKIVKGSFVGASGHRRNELSTWTSVRPRVLRIPAGGLSQATVTIRVPTDAAPGERYGVVWAEVRSTSRGPGRLIQVNRVGIRIYLSVGPGGSPAANFVIDSMTAGRSAGGQPEVSAIVRNTGGRALDMNGALRLLDGPSGLTAGPFPVRLGTTLGLGKTGSVTVVMGEDLPAGPWHAKMTLKSGLLTRTVHARLTFPEAGASVPVIVSPGWPGWFQFGLVIPILAIIAAIAAMLVARGRRRAVSV